MYNSIGTLHCNIVQLTLHCYSLILCVTMLFIGCYMVLEGMTYLG